MNQHGQLAMSQLQRFHPAEFAAIANPKEHFAALGEEMATAIAALSTQLAGPDTVGETYLEKVARLNTARQRATEHVYDTFQVFLTPETTDREAWEYDTMASLDSLMMFVTEIEREAWTETPAPLSLEELAQEYMMPLTVLQKLLKAESRDDYENSGEFQMAWETSVQRRWEMYQRSQ